MQTDGVALNAPKVAAFSLSVIVYTRVLGAAGAFTFVFTASSQISATVSEIVASAEPVGEFVEEVPLILST